MDISGLLQTRGGLIAFQNSLSAEQAEQFNGEIFNGYQIESLISQGGMGMVFKAHRVDGSFERVAAIKIIDPLQLSKDLKLRFLVERQILASLTHANIAQLYDGGVTDDGFPYLIMEYIEGLHLDDYCQQHTPSLEQRLGLFKQIAAAVQYAHGHQIIHRDIKPSNIMVDQQGCPKLLDFGIAKMAGEPVTTAQTLLTPRYASPEQMSGGDITILSDIFQLGGILNYLLTGQPIYEGESEQEIVKSVKQKASFRPPSQQLKEASHPHAGDYHAVKGDLDAIIDKCFQIEQEKRYPTVANLLDDIDNYENHRPVLARNHDRLYRLTKTIRRNLAAVSVAAVSSGLILFSLVIYILQINHVKTQALDNLEKYHASNKILKELLTEVQTLDSGTPEPTITESLRAKGTAIIADETISRDVKADLVSFIALPLLDRGEKKVAEDMLAMLIDKTKTPQSAVEADLFLKLGYAHHRSGKREQAHRLGKIAFEYYAGENFLADDKVKLRVTTIYGLILRYSDPRESERHMDSVEKLYHDMSLTDSIDYHNFLGNYASAKYDWKSPGYEEIVFKSYQLSSEAFGPDHPRMVVPMQLMSTLKLDLGDFASCIEFAGKALELTEKYQLRDLEYWVLHPLGRCLVGAGEFEQGVATIERKINLAQASDINEPDDQYIDYACLAIGYRGLENDINYQKYRQLMASSLQGRKAPSLTFHPCGAHGHH